MVISVDLLYNNKKELIKMEVLAMQTIKKLDFNKIAHRCTKTISSTEALKDVTPIAWSKEVLSGEKKVIITKGGK